MDSLKKNAAAVQVCIFQFKMFDLRIMKLKANYIRTKILLLNGQRNIIGKV